MAEHAARISMKIKYGVVVLVLSFAANCVAQQVTLEDLKGDYVRGSDLTWSSEQQWGGMTTILKLHDGGRYDYGNRCFNTSGKFTLSGRLLTRKVGINGPNSCFFSIPVKAEDASKAPPKPEDQKLVPVRWSERIYLVEESRWEDFVSAINLGLLPHTIQERDMYMGAFYSKVGDEEKPVTGLPDIPDEWKRLILKKAVSAKVIAVRKIGEHKFVVKIDKGREHGLRTNMRMLVGDAVPSIFGAWVKSLDNRTSELHSPFEVRVGETVTTKFLRPTKSNDQTK